MGGAFVLLLAVCVVEPMTSHIDQSWPSAFLGRPSMVFPLKIKSVGMGPCEN